MKQKIFIIIILLSFIIAFSGCKGGDSNSPVVKKEEGVVSQSNESSLKDKSSVQQQSAVSASSVSTSSFYKVSATPENPKVGDIVKISVTKSDNSEIGSAYITYEWRKNGETLKETTNALKISGDFKRGDKIETTVNITDIEGRKETLVVPVDIINAPPEIVEVTDIVKLDNNRFSFHVKAKDLDGDELKYSLRTPSEGVNIDSLTGQVTITVKENINVKIPVFVLITDGNGGETRFSTNVIISANPQP